LAAHAAQAFAHIRLFKTTEGGYQQMKPHPLPWLVEILNGVEHANFFEQRATEYSKGASRGTWDGEEGVWAAFDRRQMAPTAHG
jgi:ribonucleoside-diphosphate reductase beta chain